jgi:hypothetical protein
MMKTEAEILAGNRVILVRTRWDRIFQAVLFGVGILWVAFFGLILWSLITGQPDQSDLLRALTELKKDLDRQEIFHEYIACLLESGIDRTPVEVAACQVALG